MYVCVIRVCQCLRRPEEGFRFPGIGTISGYELSSMGTGNCRWVLCKRCQIS